MAEPNVLLLDEPTNDLDIETLTALEDLLDGWAGTLLVVSHDRYLLERVCDRQVALLGDGAGPRPARRRRGVPRACAGGRGRATARPRRRPRRRRPSGAADGAGPAATCARPARSSRGIERQLVAAAPTQEAKLHAAMAEQATDHDGGAGARRRAARGGRRARPLEDEWLQAARPPTARRVNLRQAPLTVRIVAA